ncbi:hypothetical protein CN952_23585 [Bacillus cereus]|uniref:hypothetical protein n=1 Tax=Bacillus cereus TaxID=1396 RepID=UPI000BFBC135|nr:hypothetical protein [Bacillus cereus]PGM68831.1 hypothetical protein CN952_23585 [Bacillus cereus]PGN02620.1 hypothetical protein CN954_29360 [Bacillus cereus]
MLQSFKRNASYAFSSVSGTIVTKIPQGELIEAYYKFAKSKDGGKGTGKTSEIAKESGKVAQTLEAARAQQRTVIESVESGEVALKTTKRKGNYGEMKMDDFFESQTYTRISDDRVLTLDQKVVKGIDAVYENSSPPPKYVIAEAKYNTSKLGKTNDGKQMSEDWILGSERLDSTLSKEKADEIVEEMLLNPENVQRIVIQVMPDGTIVKKILEV